MKRTRPLPSLTAILPTAREALRPAKLAEVTADRIKGEIMDMGWPVGRVLGNEAQLIDRYGVSRATLREAIRQLESSGSASMRRGFGGGLVVLEPTRNAVVFSLASYLQFIGVRSDELYETRLVVDGLTAQLACSRITEDGATRLKEALRALLESPIDNFEHEAALQIALRDAISDIARNPAAAVLTMALHHLSANVIRPVAPKHLTRAAQRARDTAQAIAEAIIAGDELLARQLVKEDIETTRKLYEEQLLRSQRTPKDGPLAAPAPGGRKADAKLGMRVALAISREIARRGDDPGNKLGSEEQLQQHFGVSRATLREAIRTLECHNIIRIQRGYGGGVVAGRPDPAYSLALFESYLGYVKLKPGHCYEVWRALQIAAAQFAAERAGDAFSEPLAVALQNEKAASRSELPAVMSELHRLAAEWSGNRAIALFCGALDRVALKFPAGTPSEDVAALLRQSHRDLYGAMMKRDGGMARRAMLHHLKLIDASFGEQARRNWIADTKAKTILNQL